MTPSFSPSAWLVVYGALVLLASLAGGWLLLTMRLTHTRLQIAVSFVSGLMLSVALLRFIPHSVHEIGSIETTVQWVLAGFLVMFFLQRFLPYHHHDVEGEEPEGHCGHSGPHDHLSEHSHGHSHSHGEAPSTPSAPRAPGLSWVATTVGMSLHSLVDGIALASSMLANQHGSAGLLVLGTAMAIILHKPLDAMAVATLMTASGCSRTLRQVVNTLLALVTPAGMILFYLGASQFAEANPAVLGSALAFSAGTFLCISASDLLPELQFHSHDRVKLSVALLAGLIVAVLVGLGDVHEHEKEHGEGHGEATAPAAAK